MGFDYREMRDRIWGTMRTDKGSFGRAVRRADLCGTERLVLLALIEFAPNIAPSVSTLAVMADTTERTVQRTLRALEAKGCIVRHERPGRRSEYTLALPPVEQAGDVHVTPDADVTPDTSVTPDAHVGGTPDTSVTPPLTWVSPEVVNKDVKEVGKDIVAADAAPFELRAPEVKPGKAKQPKPAKAPKAEPSGFHQVVKHWCDGFERSRGQSYKFSAVHGKQVKALLAAHGGDVGETCRTIDRAFADPFWGSRITLGQLAADPNRVVTAPSTGGRALQPLPRDGVRRVQDDPEWHLDEAENKRRLAALGITDDC